MRSQTFVLYVQTGSDGFAPVTLVINELPDGTLEFKLSNSDDNDGLIGDIRALYFDVSDNALLGGLAVSGSDITQFDQSGNVNNLGGGTSINGVPDSPFEIGIEFGTPGISTDDIQTTSFILSASRPLTLDDIALESIAVRQTSVTSADGGRQDSDKLYGDVPYAVNAIDDDITAYEDEVVAGNLFLNDIDLDNADTNGDGIPDGLTVTDVIGGLSQNPADGIFITVSSDGSYTIDSVDADWLGANETFTGSFEYSVSDGNGGSDTAVVNYTVHGVNDTPIALDDQSSTNEDTVVSGNVLLNDSDPDLNDVLTVSALNGDNQAIGSEYTLASGAIVTLNADGTYTYNPNGAFDSLNDGEQATDSFTYQVSDGNGGSSTATVFLTIEGLGGGGGTGGGDNHFGTFSNKKGTADHEISNIVLYLRSDSGSILKVKVDNFSGETDLDNVDLGAFLENYGYIDYELVAVSIKAGNNHNSDLGPGEGQLFLLDGDDDIDYFEGGAVPEGLTLDDLSAKADVTYSFDDGLFG